MPVHKAVRYFGSVAALLCLTLLSVVLIGNGRAAAAPPVLDIPVTCEPGRDCFIQFYVDRDSGAGIADYRCAGLTYDGHRGTDFRLADIPAMRRGVTVRGVVVDRPRTQGISIERSGGVSKLESVVVRGVRPAEDGTVVGIRVFPREPVPPMCLKS